MKNTIPILICWLYDEEKVLDGPHRLDQLQYPTREKKDSEGESKAA